MTFGNFQRKLKQLNKQLCVWTNLNSDKPASIFLVLNGEFIQICGIDKGEIPMYPIRDGVGHFLKSGWRRALKILIDKRFIDRRKAEKIFRLGLQAPNPRWIPEEDYTWKQIQEIQTKRFLKTGNLDQIGNPVLRRNDVMEMSEVLRSVKK